MRLLLDPVGEFYDIWMRCQQFDCIEIVFEVFVIDHGMHVVVAWLTQPGNTLFDFRTVKVLLIPLVLMSGSRDEMVLCQSRYRATT